MIAQTVADELGAARGCMVAAMNSLAGPYGKAHGRCVSDLNYACYHVANALLASRGIAVRSPEAVPKLLALHFVKPAALPQETIAKFNELMDKRHAADYKTYIAIGAAEVAALRPWIAGFLRDALRLLGKDAPAREAKFLQQLVGDFERIALE